MPDYILRNIDRPTWDKFKARAAREGHKLRWVLLKLIGRYVKHGLDKDEEKA